MAGKVLRIGPVVVMTRSTFIETLGRIYRDGVDAGMNREAVDAIVIAQEQDGLTARALRRES